jgi:hypothetical protein
MDQPNVIIHARFAPNGTVVEISERPSGLTAQQWFNVLSEKTDAYQSLAGGRGVFRLGREVIDALKQEVTVAAA